MRMIAFVMAALVAGSAPTPNRVDPWPVAGASSAEWESHPAIDPLTGDLWFVRSSKDFSGWHLMVSRCVAGVRRDAVAAPFAAAGLEADPFFADGGHSLYFISTRASGTMASAGLDIWVATRRADGSWASPVRLPSPVNSDQTEWFPRPASDGWLYFGSRRAGGLGKDDIWRAKHGRSGKWVVENADPGLNSAGAEYELEPSADGRWGVMSTDSGLVRVEHGVRGWHRAGKLDPSINVNGTEIGPLLSPSGKSLLYSRDAGNGRSGELFLAHLAPEKSWPTSCPGKATS